MSNFREFVEEVFSKENFSEETRQLVLVKMQEAYTLGHNDGYNLGYDAAIENSLDNVDEARDVGFEEGYDKGYSVGYDDAWDEAELKYDVRLWNRNHMKGG